MGAQELYIDSVEHNYDGRPILAGVYLACKRGEIVGLLGRNGSGKTTLLKIIFGSLKPKFKYQRIDDKLINTGYETGKIGYLSQENFVPFHLTVCKAITFFGNRYKQQLLEIPVIQENLHKKFNELSGGQVRLIECLLILYSDAEFILLDEPFSQTAPILIAEMQKHIHSLKNEKGFIITDHYHEHIREIATRVVLLHNGSNYPIHTREDLVLHKYLPG